MSPASFRDYLPKPNDVPLASVRRDNVHQFSRESLQEPSVKDLFSEWADSLNTPFRGVTSDGQKIDGLYKIEDQGAPTEAAVVAANRIIDVLTPDEKLLALHDIDSEDWRKWTNTEIILFDEALRLEEISPNKIDLVWKLVEASLSAEGFARVKNVTKINGFLGKLAKSEVIVNENSYGFMVFGQPSLRTPWGFSLTGHHLCLNVFFVGRQMVIAPAFVGAEPNLIDEGPDEGVQLFRAETASALGFIESLSAEQLKQVRQDVPFHQPDVPDWNIVDQRHRGGAGRDNRVIPYEGLVASSLSTKQQSLLVDLLKSFQLLPEEPLEHYLKLVRKHLDQTYITWIGSIERDEPFYLRVQSPVVLIEMDHHTGIYLSNKDIPRNFHAHTIQRQPNGNDYARELITNWYKSQPQLPVSGSMKYIRHINDARAFDTGFPKYRAQILSSLESALFISSVIDEGGCGPGLHYHHSDQFYFLVKGTMTVRLGDEEYFVPTGSLVFIPAGLPHCNWNDGPGAETHLEMIIPAPDRIKQIAYMIDNASDVPKEWRTSKKGYVRSVKRESLKEPLPGFRLLPLADPSTGSDDAQVMYAEVAPGGGGPSTHIHEFDQYYFVLEGEMTVEVALQKHIVTPNRLVILPAGVPHRQYNAGKTTEKHVTINTPTPQDGRSWDYGVHFEVNGDNHFGNLRAASTAVDAQPANGKAVNGQ
ncbi:hypothetical protein ACN47E_002490 [Coniothyrium glycines]